LGKVHSKDSCLLETIGTLDEVQSIISVIQLRVTSYELQNIVKDLQGIMGELATGKPVIGYELRVMSLEKEIGEIEKKLPKQDKFLSFEKEGAVYLNWTRTVARRAERVLVKYNKKCQNLDPNILIYINRLSDYLFILAREVESKS